MLCPKGSLTTRACCGDSFLLQPPSRPLALAGASRHCAFAENNGVERLGRLVRRRTGRQADRHRALLSRGTQIPEYVLKGCLAGFECSVTSTIDPRMMVTLTPCCGSSQVKVSARPVRPSVLLHHSVVSELFVVYLSTIRVVINVVRFESQFASRPIPRRSEGGDLIYLRGQTRAETRKPGSTGRGSKLPFPACGPVLRYLPLNVHNNL
jgi:hypothetical protein